MPELPEVETVRMQLLDKVVGKTIKGVEVFHSKSVGDDNSVPDRLIGKKIKHVDRVGKLMIFSFVKENDLFLLAHLKMTGQFFYIEKGEVATGGGHSMSQNDVKEFPGKHTRVGFYFKDGSKLYFNDMRIFGYVKLSDAEGVAYARAGYGPEPIADDFDLDYFIEKLKKRSIAIKAALLDQKFVAGLGNIYVDEALWRSKVSPIRPSNQITKKEAAAIAAAAKDVMLESITMGGTTFQNFKDTKGENGNFKDFLQVFGKQNTPCKRCGKTIQKIRVAGRGTHYCPHCQK